VIVSNLGLTAFVKQPVAQVPQPALRERKKKLLKGKNLRFLFLPLTGAKASRCSLSLFS
jgi:hypothetical protein